jgi:hypothetical protein
MVADETMIGFTGATNIHLTVLPDKPTSKGVCLKTLCDASTRVMIAAEFVEGKAEQVLKRYAEEGLAPALTLQLIEPWHNKASRIVTADACFDGMPTGYALMQRSLFSITNVKIHTKYFCKKELWADARGVRATHDRNDRAFRQLKMKVNGKDINFTGAFHMDRRQMTLLSTAGSSNNAPVVMRRYVCMSDVGDMVRWQGELQQPDVHYMHWSNFNAVDVHNKLAVGPHSVCNKGANLQPLKLWLRILAIAKTNAYLAFVKHHKLTSERYNHADFKVDLERALLRRAQQLSGDSGEEAVVRTWLSHDRVATGDATMKRKRMPTVFQAHMLQRDETKNCKCMIRGTKTKVICGCGRAICSSTGGVTCWAWYLEAVASGAADEGPVQWHRDQRSSKTVVTSCNMS